MDDDDEEEDEDMDEDEEVDEESEDIESSPEKPSVHRLRGGKRVTYLMGI